MKGKLKLVIESPTDPTKAFLYVLAADKTEATNVAAQYPEMVAEMRKEIFEFLASAKHSHDGGKYGTDIQPMEPWLSLGELSRKE